MFFFYCTYTCTCKCFVVFKCPFEFASSHADLRDLNLSWLVATGHKTQQNTYMYMFQSVCTIHLAGKKNMHSSVVYTIKAWTSTTTGTLKHMQEHLHVHVYLAQLKKNMHS